MQPPGFHMYDVAHSSQLQPSARNTEYMRAQAATTRMRSMDTAGVTDDEWAAVRDVLAGVLPKSVRVEGMEKQAKAAAVQQMAGAIYTLQREVMAMMVDREVGRDAGAAGGANGRCSGAGRDG